MSVDLEARVRALEEQLRAEQQWREQVSAHARELLGTQANNVMTLAGRVVKMTNGAMQTYHKADELTRARIADFAATGPDVLFAHDLELLMLDKKGAVK